MKLRNLSTGVSTRQLRGRSLATRRKVNEHVLNHENKSASSVRSKEVSNKSSSKTHSRIHNDDRGFLCNVCNRKFLSESKLKMHISIHDKKSVHSCKTCGKQFASKSKLTIHHAVHSNKKPYECDTCGRQFSQKGNLNTHSLIHSGKKPHTCEVCGKQFAQKVNLNTHRLIHSGIKPHTCKICKKKFSQIGNLYTHSFTHSGKKPHACDICSKEFAQKSNLSKHFRVCNIKLETAAITKKSLRNKNDARSRATDSHTSQHDIKLELSDSMDITSVELQEKVIEWSFTKVLIKCEPFCTSQSISEAACKKTPSKTARNKYIPSLSESEPSNVTEVLPRSCNLNPPTDLSTPLARETSSLVGSNPPDLQLNRDASPFNSDRCALMEIERIECNEMNTMEHDFQLENHSDQCLVDADSGNHDSSSSSMVCDAAPNDKTIEHGVTSNSNPDLHEMTGNAESNYTKEQLITKDENLLNGKLDILENPLKPLSVEDKMHEDNRDTVEHGVKSNSNSDLREMTENGEFDNREELLITEDEMLLNGKLSMSENPPKPLSVEDKMHEDNRDTVEHGVKSNSNSDLHEMTENSEFNNREELLITEDEMPLNGKLSISENPVKPLSTEDKAHRDSQYVMGSEPHDVNEILKARDVNITETRNEILEDRNNECEIRDGEPEASSFRLTEKASPIMNDRLSLIEYGMDQSQEVVAHHSLPSVPNAELTNTELDSSIDPSVSEHGVASIHDSSEATSFTRKDVFDPNTFETPLKNPEQNFNKQFYVTENESFSEKLKCTRYGLFRDIYGKDSFFPKSPESSGIDEGVYEECHLDTTGNLIRPEYRFAKGENDSFDESEGSTLYLPHTLPTHESDRLALCGNTRDKYEEVNCTMMHDNVPNEHTVEEPLATCEAEMDSPVLSSDTTTCAGDNATNEYVNFFGKDHLQATQNKSKYDVDFKF